MAPVTNCIPDHPQLISSLYITITTYTPSLLFHTISTPDIPACLTHDSSHCLILLLPMALYPYHSDPHNIQNVLGCSYSSWNASTLNMEAVSYCRMSELLSSIHSINVEEDLEFPSTPPSEPQMSQTLTFSGAPVSSLLRHCTTCDMSSHGRPSSETWWNR